MEINITQADLTAHHRHLLHFTCSHFTSRQTKVFGLRLLNEDLHSNEHGSISDVE
jgi:hypothetical protein